NVDGYPIKYSVIFTRCPESGFKGLTTNPWFFANDRECLHRKIKYNNTPMLYTSVYYDEVLIVHFNSFIFLEPFRKETFKRYRFEFAVHFFNHDMRRRTVSAQFTIAVNDFNTVIRSHSRILSDPRSDEGAVTVFQCLYISNIQIINRCIISFTFHCEIIITDIRNQLHPAHLKPFWIISMVNNTHHI